jgi:hypothetical protein
MATTATDPVVILFGGVHRYRGKQAAMFAAGRWETPLGRCSVNERLAERILGHTSLIVDDPYAHEEEHSIEVQLPFVQQLFPKVTIVPIMVPPASTAHAVGDSVARTLVAYKYDALILGTTDLTHYGPRYHFVPQGTGRQANAWAKVENDRRFIDLVVKMKSDEVVGEAAERRNACSAGAAAATMSACRVLGATQGVLLRHTTSSEVIAGMGEGDVEDSVGYAGIVFVR